MKGERCPHSKWLRIAERGGRGSMQGCGVVMKARRVGVDLRLTGNLGILRDGRNNPHQKSEVGAQITPVLSPNTHPFNWAFCGTDGRLVVRRVRSYRRRSYQ